jgi:hypothetical protein
MSDKQVKFMQRRGSRSWHVTLLPVEVEEAELAFAQRFCDFEVRFSAGPIFICTLEVLCENSEQAVHTARLIAVAVLDARQRRDITAQQSQAIVERTAQAISFAARAPCGTTR